MIISKESEEHPVRSARKKRAATKLSRHKISHMHSELRMVDPSRSFQTTQEESPSTFSPIARPLRRISSMDRLGRRNSQRNLNFKKSSSSRNFSVEESKKRRLDVSVGVQSGEDEPRVDDGTKSLPRQKKSGRSKSPISKRKSTKTRPTGTSNLLKVEDLTSTRISQGSSGLENMLKEGDKTGGNSSSSFRRTKSGRSKSPKRKSSNYVETSAITRSLLRTAEGNPDDGNHLDVQESKRTGEKTKESKRRPSLGRSKSPLSKRKSTRKAGIATGNLTTTAEDALSSTSGMSNSPTKKDTRRRRSSTSTLSTRETVTLEEDDGSTNALSPEEDDDINSLDGVDESSLYGLSRSSSRDLMPSLSAHKPRLQDNTPLVKSLHASGSIMLSLIPDGQTLESSVPSRTRKDAKKGVTSNYPSSIKSHPNKKSPKGNLRRKSIPKSLLGSYRSTSDGEESSEEEELNDTIAFPESAASQQEASIEVKEPSVLSLTEASQSGATDIPAASETRKSENSSSPSSGSSYLADRDTSKLRPTRRVQSLDPSRSLRPRSMSLDPYAARRQAISSPVRKTKRPSCTRSPKMDPPLNELLFQISLDNDDEYENLILERSTQIKNGTEMNTVANVSEDAATRMQGSQSSRKTRKKKQSYSAHGESPASLRTNSAHSVTSTSGSRSRTHHSDDFVPLVDSDDDAQNFASPRRIKSLDVSSKRSDRGKKKSQTTPSSSLSRRRLTETGKTKAAENVQEELMRIILGHDGDGKVLDSKVERFDASRNPPKRTKSKSPKRGTSRKSHTASKSRTKSPKRGAKKAETQELVDAVPMKTDDSVVNAGNAKIEETAATVQENQSILKEGPTSLLIIERASRSKSPHLTNATIGKLPRAKLKPRSRSQSPRKPKRQPKSHRNPEKLAKWQIRQQQRHRVMPVFSPYTRRLDDDDDYYYKEEDESKNAPTKDTRTSRSSKPTKGSRSRASSARPSLQRYQSEPILEVFERLAITPSTPTPPPTTHESELEQDDRDFLTVSSAIDQSHQEDAIIVSSILP